MIDKEQMIGELIKVLSREDVDIIYISIDNERTHVGSGANSESMLTGHKEITIELLDKKLNSDYIKKLNKQ